MELSIFDTPRAAGPFTVLTVCTGNICRSPLAELLLRKILADLSVEVSSSGTHAHVGEGMQEPNQQIASELGVTDGASHVARQLTLEQLRNADLVLALGREHRREVAELYPRANRYTFTLREFAALAAAVTSEDLESIDSTTAPDRMRAAVELAAQLRGTLPPLEDPIDDDVIDPYQQSIDVYRVSEAQLVPAVNATATLLRRASKVGA